MPPGRPPSCATCPCPDRRAHGREAGILTGGGTKSAAATACHGHRHVRAGEGEHRLSARGNSAQRQQSIPLCFEPLALAAMITLGGQQGAW